MQPVNEEAGVDEEVVLLIIFVLFVLVGLTLLVVAMGNRRHLREIAHRERLAMIERGVVPAPERDPVKFEAGTGLASADAPPARRGERYRIIGVTMIGLGVGLALLIAFTAGAPDIALGVGGAWIALGAASLLNYALIRRER